MKESDTPKEAILGVALVPFDVIAVHRRLATRLTIQIVRHPLGQVTVSIFERIGRQVEALGVRSHMAKAATGAIPVHARHR